MCSEEEKVEAVIHQFDCTVCKGLPKFVKGDFSNICDEHLLKMGEGLDWKKYKGIVNEFVKRGLQLK